MEVFLRFTFWFLFNFGVCSIMDGYAGNAGGWFNWYSAK